MKATFVLFLISIVESKRQRQQDLSMSESRLGRQSFDFGHVYRNDMGKNTQEDFPELEMPKSKKQYPKEAPNENLTFLSPRDQVQHEINMNKTKPIDGDREPIIFDYSKFLERNIARPSAVMSNNANYMKHTATTKSFTIMDRLDIENNFEGNTFLKKTNKNLRNWTTCDEFKKKAVFHPDDVINTKWLPFYIWSERGFNAAFIHSLSYPTKKTVQHYKTSYGPYISKKINWREPKLLLKERRDMLLIAGDRRGLFFGIPEHDLGLPVKGQNITIPIIPLRMKIYDPYLVMMYCDDCYATVMAELNTGPQNEHDKILEAQTLNFKGKGKPAIYNEQVEKRLDNSWNKKYKEIQSKKFVDVEELTRFVNRKYGE